MKKKVLKSLVQLTKVLVHNEEEISEEEQNQIDIYEQEMLDRLY